MLRQYLQEVGFTDTILDARSARLRALLGGTGSNEGNSINIVRVYKIIMCSKLERTQSF